MPPEEPKVVEEVKKNKTYSDDFHAECIKSIDSYGINGIKAYDKERILSFGKEVKIWNAINGEHLDSLKGRIFGYIKIEIFRKIICILKRSHGYNKLFGNFSQW